MELPSYIFLGIIENGDNTDSCDVRCSDHNCCDDKKIIFMIITVICKLKLTLRLHLSNY